MSRTTLLLAVTTLTALLHAGVPEDAKALLAALSGSEGLERRRLTQELIQLGPEALATVRAARDAATGEDRETLAHVARWQLAAELRPALAAGLASELSFDGQYADLAKHGDEAVDALLAIVDDSASDYPLRVASCRAIADIGDPKILPRLRALYHDKLLPTSLREQMGILMAIFGDRQTVEKEIAEYERYDANPDLRIVLGASLQLSNLYYRIRDYGKAVEYYDRIIGIFEDLLARQEDPAFRRSISADLTLHYYNAACSNCLHGDLDKTKQLLRKAVAGDPAHLENIEHDGDLRRLREDPSYDAFRRELGAIFEDEEI